MLATTKKVKSQAQTKFIHFVFHLFIFREKVKNLFQNILPSTIEIFRNSLFIWFSRNSLFIQFKHFIHCLFVSDIFFFKFRLLVNCRRCQAPKNWQHYVFLLFSSQILFFFIHHKSAPKMFFWRIAEGAKLLKTDDFACFYCFQAKFFFFYSSQICPPTCFSRELPKVPNS